MTARIVGLAVLASVACSGPPKRAAEPRPASGVWKLVELGGKPAPTGQEGKPAMLELREEGRRATGFAGCNRMAGTYEVRGDSLRFSPLILTRMACRNGMDLEQAYVDALQATRSYRSTATGLELSGEAGHLARFEAQ